MKVDVLIVVILVVTEDIAMSPRVGPLCSRKCRCGPDSRLFARSSATAASYLARDWISATLTKAETAGEVAGPVVAMVAALVTWCYEV